MHRAQDPVVVRRQPGPRLVLGEPHRRRLLDSRHAAVKGTAGSLRWRGRCDEPGRLGGAPGRLRPDDPALADGERVHADWATFAARTAAAAAGLRDGFGLSPGDRVAIVMRNRPEYLEALFAIWHAGLVAVPVNARLHRDEIGYILEHSETAVAVTDADHAGDAESLVGTVASLRGPWSLRRAKRWDRLTASSPTWLVGRRPEDPASGLFYTSGTMADSCSM